MADNHNHNHNHNHKALVITGSSLIAVAAVFSTLAISVQAAGLWSIALGAAAMGLPMLLVGSRQAQDIEE